MKNFDTLSRSGDLAGINMIVASVFICLSGSSYEGSNLITSGYNPYTQNTNLRKKNNNEWENYNFPSNIQILSQPEFEEDMIEAEMFDKVLGFKPNKITFVRTHFVKGHKANFNFSPAEDWELID